MYLWDINELVTKLKNNTLSRREVSTFYIISPLLSICNGLFFSSLLISHHFVATLFAHFLEEHDIKMPLYNLLGIMSGTITTLITILGIYLCYRTNKRGDGKDFSKRMACLSFPINFHLTIYVLAILSLIALFGYLVIHGKIVFFKQQVMRCKSGDCTVGQALQTALNDTALKPIVPKVKEAKGFLGTLLGAPITTLKLSTIPGKINDFLKTIRSSVLIGYPLITLLPPALSLCHYLILRRMLRKVSFKGQN